MIRTSDRSGSRSRKLNLVECRWSRRRTIVYNVSIMIRRSVIVLQMRSMCVCVTTKLASVVNVMKRMHWTIELRRDTTRIIKLLWLHWRYHLMMIVDMRRGNARQNRDGTNTTTSETSSSNGTTVLLLACVVLLRNSLFLRTRLGCDCRVSSSFLTTINLVRSQLLERCFLQQVDVCKVVGEYLLVGRQLNNLLFLAL